MMGSQFRASPMVILDAPRALVPRHLPENYLQLLLDFRQRRVRLVHQLEGHQHERRNGFFVVVELGGPAAAVASTRLRAR
jgi:hypothetical protein